jgi:hypothetical protein
LINQLVCKTRDEEKGIEAAPALDGEGCVKLSNAFSRH